MANSGFSKIRLAAPLRFMVVNRSRGLAARHKRLQAVRVYSVGEEARRDRFSEPDQHPGDGDTEFLSDAVLPPLVDPLSVDPLSGHLSQDVCDSAAATERLDDVAMSVHDNKVGKIFRHVKSNGSENVSDDLSSLAAHTSRMSQPRAKSIEKPKDPYKVAVGERLKMAREALGYETIRRFAKEFEVEESRATKWEGGDALVPPQFIGKLKARHGVDHNWIFDGDAKSLPHGLAQQIFGKSA